MGERVPEPCAKGAICYCLDEVSKGRGARSRITQLRDALEAAPDFNDLTRIFDENLLTHVMTAADRRSAVRHLQRHWFDQASPDAYFPGEPVASIYGQGVIRALNLALASRRGVVPLNAWWLIDSSREVTLYSLADVDRGVTIGGRVTLLILTPPPRGDDPPANEPIKGATAQAWVTHRGGTIDVRRAAADRRG
jgi:hypothetical protein